MALSQVIEWDDVIKKEARGTNDADLGEVQEIGQTYVLTQKGTLGRCDAKFSGSIIFKSFCNLGFGIHDKRPSCYYWLSCWFSCP